jgi:hypothetical protein
LDADEAIDELTGTFVPAANWLSSPEDYAMSCFSLDFMERVCILVVICMGLWAIIKLFLPFLMAHLPPLVVQIINIVIWVVIAIICIVIIFALLSCLVGAMGGLGGLSHPFR